MLIYLIYYVQHNYTICEGLCQLACRAKFVYRGSGLLIAVLLSCVGLCRRAVPCRAVPCRAVPCRAVLCCVVLCCVVLCCVVLC